MKHFGATQWVEFKKPKLIMYVMNKLENGATGVIFGDRGPGVVGHYFNVVKKDGMVLFVDFQRDIGERVLNPNTLMKDFKFYELWFINTTGK